MNLGHLDFDIVSDFDIRISDFASLCPLHLSRVLYKSPLFMQNKANFLDALMNVTSFITTYYENKWQRRVRKNKPNSNPIRTQSNPISEKPKMNVNKVLRGDYENKSHFAAIAKQTQSNPISNLTLLKWVITTVKCFHSEICHSCAGRNP